VRARARFCIVAKAAAKSRLPLPAASGHVGWIGQLVGIGARGYLFESGCRLWRATEPWPERTDHQPPCGSRERARQELSGSRTNPNVVVLTLS
jgi:hypothetical protein